MIKIKIALLACGFVLLLSNYSFAKVPIMTVNELKPGMKGIGRTVIRGTVPEEFNIEIIGVLQKGGFSGGPMILIKCTGPVIDATGGVAGGYSGSPIFIDGKLVGALSAAWYFADHSIAGVTPINDMLKNFYYPEKNDEEIKLAKLDEPLQLFGKTIKSSILCMNNESSKTTENKANENTMVLTACKTPLFINGLSPQLVDKVKEFLAPKLPYMEIMAGPGGGMDDKSWDKITLMDNRATLEPGSAIGMQLVTGDIDFTAVGTLTYIDPDDPDGKILLFGHPFLQKGNVDAPLTSARIVFTVPAMDRSFKIGEAISIVGTALQDRSCAVSGQLGKKPGLVKVRFEINDLNQGRSKVFNVGVLRDEELMPFLTILPLAQGLSQTIDRQGPSTVKVSFTIDGEGLAEPIKRDNVYFSDYSGLEILTELMEMLSLLTSSNIFREVAINEIDLKVELTENRQTLDIIGIDFLDDAQKKPEKPSATEQATMPESNQVSEGDIMEIDLQQSPQPSQQTQTNVDATAQKQVISQPELKSFKPGDKIRIKATLKPYRDESFDQILELTIPADINPGITQIIVRGGGGMPNRFMMGAEMALIPIAIPMQGMVPMMLPEKPPKSLDEIIDKILKRDKNNDLVLELMHPMSMELPKKDKKDDDKAIPEPIKTIQSRDKIIYGVFQLPIEIKKPEEPEKEEKKDGGQAPAAKEKETAPSGEAAPAEKSKEEPSKRKDFKYKSKR